MVPSFKCVREFLRFPCRRVAAPDGPLRCPRRPQVAALRRNTLRTDASVEMGSYTTLCFSAYTFFLWDVIHPLGSETPKVDMDIFCHQ